MDARWLVVRQSSFGSPGTLNPGSQREALTRGKTWPPQWAPTTKGRSRWQRHQEEDKETCRQSGERKKPREGAGNAAKRCWGGPTGFSVVFQGLLWETLLKALFIRRPGLSLGMSAGGVMSLDIPRTQPRELAACEAVSSWRWIWCGLQN